MDFSSLTSSNRILTDVRFSGGTVTGNFQAVTFVNEVLFDNVQLANMNLCGAIFPSAQILNQATVDAAFSSVHWRKVQSSSNIGTVLCPYGDNDYPLQGCSSDYQYFTPAGSCPTDPNP